jgi:phage anti-repressor protein
MNDLITITEHEGKPVIDARHLHQCLEVGRDFSTWIKDRIEKYEFVEGEDYHLPKFGENQDARFPLNPDLSKQGKTENLIFTKTGENQVRHGGKREGAGRPETDYLLSIDTAKEIAIVENNPRAVRSAVTLLSSKKPGIPRKPSDFGLYSWGLSLIQP